MFANAIRRMPPSLVVLFVVFLIMPPWSMTFLDWPWEVAKTQGLETAAFLTMIYWVGPLLICLTMAMRSFLGRIKLSDNPFNLMARHGYVVHHFSPITRRTRAQRVAVSIR